VSVKLEWLIVDTCKISHFHRFRDSPILNYAFFSEKRKGYFREKLKVYVKKIYSTLRDVPLFSRIQCIFIVHDSYLSIEKYTKKSLFSNSIKTSLICQRINISNSSKSHGLI
jgi:hypothetical protein